MSMYYIEQNEQLEGYDIIKRDGQLVDGKPTDMRVATVYSPDMIDMLIEILDAEDKRPIEGFIIESNDEDDMPAG